LRDYSLPRDFLLPAERIFTACREIFYSLPREIFFPAERNNFSCRESLQNPSHVFFLYFYFILFLFFVAV